MRDEWYSVWFLFFLFSAVFGLLAILASWLIGWGPWSPERIKAERESRAAVLEAEMFQIQKISSGRLER